MRLQILGQQALGLLLIIFAPLLLVSSAHATPTKRGFQIPLDAITAETLDELVTTWKVNTIRVQIGDNSKMDGLTGDAYDSMMSDLFDKLDAKLPLLVARGLTMTLCLYSPPGGFETRTAPSHYLMFSRAELQEDFIDIWKTIATRYGSNSTISAFDLVNEPAARKKLMGVGVRNWSKLSKDTISAIRTIAPNKVIIVKSLYGDPSKLANLAAINDANVQYSYNSYFYGGYQHTGIDSAPFSIARPSDADILGRMRRLVAPFYLKTYQRVQNKELPESAYPPKLVVGEAAVSACATESGTFLNGLLTALETDQSATGIAERASEIDAYKRATRRWKRRHRRGRRPVPPEFAAEDFRKDVAHIEYSIHAYGDYSAWDPRYTCDASGNFSLSPTDTDRTIVAKGFFSRN